MDRPAAVLDTNAFVAAGSNPRSAFANIISAVWQGKLRMVWNDATRREVAFILSRIPPLRGTDLAELFRAEHWFAGETHPEGFDRGPDPDDRKFAALARAAQAVLVSNDEHLLGAGLGPELALLRAGEFWRQVEGREVARAEA